MPRLKLTDKAQQEKNETYHLRSNLSTKTEEIHHGIITRPNSPAVCVFARQADSTENHIQRRHTGGLDQGVINLQGNVVGEILGRYGFQGDSKSFQSAHICSHPAYIRLNPAQIRSDVAEIRSDPAQIPLRSADNGSHPAKSFTSVQMRFKIVHVHSDRTSPRATV